jgi:hypothetical protein
MIYVSLILIYLIHLSEMIVKMMSGDLITLEGDIEEVRTKINQDYYPEYPIQCIKLLESCLTSIDYFLLVNDVIDYTFKVIDKKTVDTRGQGFLYGDIVITRNRIEDDILASVYVCKNREGEDDCFVLKEDVKVILELENNITIIHTPVKYKTIKQILDIDIKLL